MINVLRIKDEKFIVKAERLIIKTIEIHTIKEKSETFLFAKSIWKKQKVIL